LGEAYGRTVLFESAQHKTPRIIESFYEPARDVLRRNWNDPLGLDAVRAYYEELYWRKGHAALDAAKLPNGETYPILASLALAEKDMSWPFADVATAFRMIDDVMDPVIIPYDDSVKRDIDALNGAPFPPAGVTRRLQRYVVPVPSRVRAEMIAVGAVQLIKPEEYGDRFALLANESLYDPQAGLRLDDPTWRKAEWNVF
jgi:CRISPR-associated endonuclease/helicase Cas3